MKARIKIALLGLLVFGTFPLIFLTGCEERLKDNKKTKKAADVLQSNQATPNDIQYSLQRYNLIRRAYWINGMYDKAESLPCDVEKFPGYIYLYSGNSLVAEYVVDGQVTSLRTYLTPDSEYYSTGNYTNEWLADIDGTYGENVDGIFFFTKDGTYVEWTGNYLYSSKPIT